MTITYNVRLRFIFYLMNHPNLPKAPILSIGASKYNHSDIKEIQILNNYLIEFNKSKSTDKKEIVMKASNELMILNQHWTEKKFVNILMII